MKLAFSGSASANFDKWDMNPGAGSSGARPFINKDEEYNFAINAGSGSSSYSETLTATLGAGSEGSRIALRARFALSGVPMGTNYVYEWKQVGSSAPLLDTEGIPGIVDID